MITTQETDAGVATPGAAAARRGLAAVWRARGWWGGLIACGLAALGQNALIGQQDPESATRYYLLAILLLLVAFVHPAWPWRRRAPADSRSASAPPSDAPPLPGAGPPTSAALTTPTPHTPAASAPLMGVPPAAPRVTPWVPGSPRPASSAVRSTPAPVALVPPGEQPAQVAALAVPAASTLPTRRVRRGAEPAPTVNVAVDVAAPVGNGYARGPEAAANGHAQAVAAANGHAGEAAVALPARPLMGRRKRQTTAAGAVPAAATETPAVAASSRWARWEARRARLGWRVTAPGLALTGALAGAATLVLRADIANPLGGWLWAGALAALILTFVGAPGWPRGAGLLPGPESDFFAAGLPRLSPRVEGVLAVGILVVSLVLRLVNLETQPGVFGDEGERGVDARGILQGSPDLLFGYGWWGVPNLYFYLVAGMLRIFGDHNMVADRMLSVVSGALAVWFVYRIGRLLWGPRAGLIAGALLAVSPLALQFSRVAGESTPTGTLWAGGFFFLFRALRFRKWLDWTLAGIVFGFSLYFYAAGKLIIPILAGVGLYCLVRWHIGFIRRYALGFGVLGLGFGLTFLPYALFSIKDNWQGFTGRAQETSIFSPQNMAQAFAKYGIPFDPLQAGQPLVQSVLTHPLAWLRLVFEQMRVTAEVIYRSGDPTPFYQIQVHGGSMLAPVWAALALLGLGYGAWKLWDARFGLIDIWFWGGMLGAALTTDTPSVQRLVGAWPVIMLFPAVVLDRVAAGAWPLSRGLARRWMNVPLAALLIFFAGDGYQEYFGHYMSLCPYCTGTVQARFAEGLGQEYKAYQFGVSGYDIFFTYGPTRFLAKGVEGADMSVPANFFPVTDNWQQGKQKGAAYIVYQPNDAYLPLIRLFYPGGAEAVQKGNDGSAQFTSYQLSPAQMATFQALDARYAPAGGGPAVGGSEPNLGTTRAASVPGGGWAPPAGLAYPVQATWQGGLVAPAYGLYTLQMQGGTDGRLEVDGRVVLDAAAAPDSKLPARAQIDLVLAKGMHDVRLTGTLADANTRLAVLWGTAGSAPAPVAPNYLYRGPTGGLSGEIWQNSSTPLDSPDLAAGQPATYRRSDPFFGFREARDDQASFGGGPFVARWTGTLTVPAAGVYQFDLQSNGPSRLLIDGQPVVIADANGNAAGASGGVTLSAGAHQVELRYGWQSGRATLEWYWTPPGGERALVPPTALTPAARSWARGDVPDPPASPAANVAPPPPAAVTVPPETVLAADAGLKEPRGIAVDAKGNIYIGDSGNHRIVHLDASGKMLGTWGSATETSAPGKFGLLADLAVTPDGHVATLDAQTGDVQVFAPDGTVAVNLPGVSGNSSGIAVGPDGRIWVASTATSSVLRFTSAGQPDGQFRGGPEGSPARFEQPIDVAVAPDGTVYVVDLHGRIMQLDAAGNVARQWPVEWGGARGGSHLAVWQGQVVMSDPDRQHLTVLDPATGAQHQVGAPGPDPGQFRLPIGLAAGPDGRLYVVDSDNARVQVFRSLEAK